MNLFNFFSRKQVEQRSLEEYNPVYGSINLGASSYTQSKALKLSTVYRCVNLLSDSV